MLVPKIPSRVYPCCSASSASRAHPSPLAGSRSVSPIFSPTSWSPARAPSPFADRDTAGSFHRRNSHSLSQWQSATCHAAWHSGSAAPAPPARCFRAGKIAIPDYFPARRFTGLVNVSTFSASAGNPPPPAHTTALFSIASHAYSRTPRESYTQNRRQCAPIPTQTGAPSGCRP
jgi:hypothetical protein